MAENHIGLVTEGLNVRRQLPDESLAIVLDREDVHPHPMQLRRKRSKFPSGTFPGLSLAMDSCNRQKVQDAAFAGGGRYQARLASRSSHCRVSTNYPARCRAAQPLHGVWSQQELADLIGEER